MVYDEYANAIYTDFTIGDKSTYYTLNYNILLVEIQLFKVNLQLMIKTMIFGRVIVYPSGWYV